MSLLDTYANENTIEQITIEPDGYKKCIITGIRKTANGALALTVKRDGSKSKFDDQIYLDRDKTDKDTKQPLKDVNGKPIKMWTTECRQLVPILGGDASNDKSIIETLKSIEVTPGTEIQVYYSRNGGQYLNPIKRDKDTKVATFKKAGESTETKTETSAVDNW
jgi:hypothetical protein